MVQEAILGSVGLVKSFPHKEETPGYRSAVGWEDLACCCPLMAPTPTENYLHSLYVVHASLERVGVGCIKSPVNEKKLCQEYV